MEINMSKQCRSSSADQLNLSRIFCHLFFYLPRLWRSRRWTLTPDRLLLQTTCHKMSDATRTQHTLSPCDVTREVIWMDVVISWTIKVKLSLWRDSSRSHIPPVVTPTSFSHTETSSMSWVASCARFSAPSWYKNLTSKKPMTSFYKVNS